MSVPEIIRQVIEIGERNGKITFDELNRLGGSGLGAEDIERILNALKPEFGLKKIKNWSGPMRPTRRVAPDEVN
jgi:hypothetical protein